VVVIFLLVNARFSMKSGYANAYVEFNAYFEVDIVYILTGNIMCSLIAKYHRYVHKYYLTIL